MSFIDNLRQKIAINDMSAAVIASLKPPGSERHLDRETMVRLLETAGYQHMSRRDLDLYLPEGDSTRNEVLVLDNDLPRYHTSVEDVELRKSPVVKEMVNFRNIRKILVDSDVVVSKQADTVNHVRQLCLDRLDLTWQPSDIHEIAALGARSLDNGYEDGVMDSLRLFSELLGYTTPPKALRVAHHEMLGESTPREGPLQSYGPIVVFSRIDDALRLVDMRVRLSDREALETATAIATGKAPTATEGAAVFEWLEEKVLKSTASAIP
jgi:hypothetical protein